MRIIIEKRKYTILLLAFVLCGAISSLELHAKTTQERTKEIAKKIFEAVTNYKNGMVEGAKAIDAIINDELPHACKEDSRGIVFEKYLNQNICNKDLFEHLSTLNNLNESVSDIIDRNKYIKDLDQWLWMRKGLKKKKKVRACQLGILKKSNFEQVKPKLALLINLQSKLKKSEKQLIKAMRNERSLNKLFKKRALVSKCLDTKGQYMQNILRDECPNTGNLEIYGEGVFNSVKEGALCSKAFSQSKSLKHKIGARFNARTSEKNKALMNRCFIESIVNHNNKRVLNDPSLSQQTISMLKEYEILKQSRKTLFELNPILKSDEIKATLGIVSYMQLKKGHGDKMLKVALKQAVDKQKKRLGQEINELGTAIQSSSSKQRKENINNYDLLKHLDDDYYDPNVHDEWNANMSCRMYIRYLREGGIDDVRKLVLDMLVVAAPLGVGLLLKEILIAQKLLSSLASVNKYSKLSIPVMKEIAKQSRNAGALHGKQIFAVEALAETYSINIDINYLENEYARCENVMTDFYANGKCQSDNKSQKNRENEYEECRSFVDQAVQTMILASIGGTFSLSNGGKSFFKKIEKRSSSESNLVIRKTLDDLGDLHKSRKGPAYMNRYNENNIYKIKGREEELYFVGIVDLIRKDLKSAGKKIDDIEVQKQIDEIMKECRK